MRYLHLAAIVGIIGLFTACGSKSNGVDDGAGANNGAASGGSGGADGGTGNSAGDGNSSGGAGANGSGNSNSTVGGTGNSSSTGGGFSIGGDGSCNQAIGIAGPAIIEFVIDNTESMSTITTSTQGQTKMERTRAAFAAEIPNFPDAFAIGLTYYHVNSGPCNDSMQAVEIAPMGTGNSAQRQALINSISTQAQIQMTPSSDAWLFGASHVLAWSAPVDFAKANRYVVVMTDGVPTRADNCAASTGCATGISLAQYQTYIDNVAAVYRSRALKTFFIGVPGSEDTSQVTCTSGIMYDPRTKLSELSIAGQTAPAGCSTTGAPYCHIDLTDQNVNFQTELQKAIETVVKSAKSCTFSVDSAIASNPNVYVDAAMTVVTYTPVGGSDTPVSESTDCSDPMGWHFLPNTNNTTLELCPSLCQAVQTTDDAVAVRFDCIKIG